jgi:hypothetical protein
MINPETNVPGICCFLGYSVIERHQHFTWTCCLYLPSSTCMLKRKAASSSKTQLPIYQTTYCHISEDWIWFWILTAHKSLILHIPHYRQYFLLPNCSLQSRWHCSCIVTDDAACSTVLITVTKNNLFIKIQLPEIQIQQNNQGKYYVQ